jgi:hypothetical protein
MLLLGHLSASYILAQVPSLFGTSLTIQEQIFVVAAGSILDFDLLIARFFVKREAYHHLTPIHTPLFTLVISFIAYFLLKNIFSTQAIIFGFLAIILHLVLDDIGYWFCRLGLQKISKVPQIFWLYPFDKRRKHYILNWQKETNQSNVGLIKNYLTLAPVNIIFEILLTICATVILLNRFYQ